VRRSAAFPGVRTSDRVSVGEAVAFMESETLQHEHHDGQSYPIKFFKLADGRGWVHDFNEEDPSQPNCAVMVGHVYVTLGHICILLLTILERDGAFGTSSE